ncbi:cytochrome P450 [Streptomyces sp. NPDC058457]|uniref:cytochrome P450 n=1 Tax=Streptomyces sp. NPDC058457 TaxID=3346507 RepID=UPI00364F7DB0
MSTPATPGILDLSDPASFSEGVPHETFDRLRQEDPVHWTPAATGTLKDGFWSLTRARDIAEVSKDTANFTTTRGVMYPINKELLEQESDSILTLDPPRHTRLRQIVAKSFSPRVASRFESWIRETTVNTLQEVRGKQAFEFVEAVASVIPALVIGQVMGVPLGDRSRLVDWGNDILAMDKSDGPERQFRALGEVAQYAFELREFKRRSPGPDVISELVNKSDAGTELTDSEYRWWVITLFVAGFETTHTALGQIVRLLLEDTGILEQARGAVTEGRSAELVEEFLRYITPAMGFARTAERDLDIGGQRVAEGDLLLMWYVAANRDPEVFDNPHHFDSQRNPSGHMTFGGGGPHNCLGSHIARLELRIFLEEYFALDTGLRLDGTPQRGWSTSINRLERLPVAWA